MTCEQRSGITQLIPLGLWHEITKPGGCSLESLLAEDRLLSFLDFTYPVKSLPLRPFFSLLRNLHTLDKEFPNGPARALENFLEKLGIKCEIDCPEGLGELLKKGAWIVYGDHPGQVEAFALILAVMKLSERPDRVREMGAEYLTRLGPNIAATVEPVYSARKDLTESQGKMPWVERQKRALVNLFREPDITPEQAGRLNIRAIQRLAKHLSDGGIVMITPQVGKVKGQNYEGVEWAAGIGRIVCQLEPETNINFCPVTFSGSLELFKALICGGKVEAEFGKPLDWDTFQKKFREKIESGVVKKAVAITEVLREHHQDCFLRGKGAVSGPRAGREGR